jgi:hypothetical protein
MHEERVVRQCGGNSAARPDAANPAFANTPRLGCAGGSQRVARPDRSRHWRRGGLTVLLDTSGTQHDTVAVPCFAST